MKRIGVILLLVLFLIIHVGHIGYYWYGLKKIDQYWQEGTELTENLKHLIVPINIPYRNNDKEYRPGQGSIRHEGIKYRIVYEKYDDQGLHILLAQDYSTQRLTREISDWVNMTTDGDMPADGSRAGLVKSLIKDYIFRDSIMLEYDLLVIKSQQPWIHVLMPSHGHIENDTPPPEGYFIPSSIS